MVVHTQTPLDVTLSFPCATETEGSAKAGQDIVYQVFQIGAPLFYFKSRVQPRDFIKMAEFETDVDYYEDDENAEDREDTSSTNKIANLFQLVLLLLLYCYVFIMTVLRYVYPASLGPLLQHWVGEVTPQPERNASNVEGL